MTTYANKAKEFYAKRSTESLAEALSFFKKHKHERIEEVKKLLALDEEINSIELVDLLWAKVVTPRMIDPESFIQAYNDAQLFLANEMMKKHPKVAWGKAGIRDGVRAKLRGGYSIVSYDNWPITVFFENSMYVGNNFARFKVLLYSTVGYIEGKAVFSEEVIRHTYGINVAPSQNKLPSRESSLTAFVVQLKVKDIETKDQILARGKNAIFSSPPQSLVYKLGDLKVNRESKILHRIRAESFPFDGSESRKDVQEWLQREARENQNDPRIADDLTIERIQYFLSWTMLNDSGVTNRNYQGLLYFYSQMFASKVNLDILSFLEEEEYFKVNAFLDYPKIDGFIKI